MHLTIPPSSQQQQTWPSTYSSSFQSDPWIRWFLHSKGTSSGRLFSGAGSSWVKACASTSQSSGPPAPEAGARPTPPALPPAPGHVWGWLCEAGGKKRKSAHRTYSRPLPSTYTLFKPARNRNGMPSVPTMRDDNNLPERTVIFMNITLLVLSAVPVNYRPAGDLCGTRWESWPPLNGPSCSCTGSLWEPAFTHWLSASQDMTHRSQGRNHLHLQRFGI